MGRMRDRYLLDTNVLIDFLADSFPPLITLKIEDIIRCSLNISVITEIELLGWHNHTSASRQASEGVIGSAY